MATERNKIYLLMLQPPIQLDKVIKIVEMTEGKKQISSNFRVYIHGWPVSVAELSEFCGRSPSETAVSNPTVSMDVCCECCVVR